MTKPSEEVMTTLRVSRAFWAKVRTQAFAEGISTREFVLKALEAYLKTKGVK
jgi:hypothetical protein